MIIMPSKWLMSCLSGHYMYRTSKGITRPGELIVICLSKMLLTDSCNSHRIQISFIRISPHLSEQTTVASYQIMIRCAALLVTDFFFLNSPNKTYIF